MTYRPHLPDDFIQHIADILPATQKLDDFLQICQQPLRKSIRINTIKVDINTVLCQLENEGWHYEFIPWCNDGVWLKHEDPQQQEQALGNHPMHLAGLFYIQEASSMLPPMALAAELNSSSFVLDMAAAPGSKTSQLAALMNNQGCLLANEFAASRIKALAANIQRLGVTNTAISHFDGTKLGPWKPEQFDAILLDAPCSAEGAVRKDHQALKNWSLSAVNTMAEVQKGLIDSAFIALKPGGTLVYSTCTLSHEENHHIVQWLCDRYKQSCEIIPLNELFTGASELCSPEGFLHVWPQIFDSEGFFVAKIGKKQSLNLPGNGRSNRHFPYQPANDKQYQAVNSYCQQQFGWQWPDHLHLYQRDNEFWLFPAQIESSLMDYRYQRVGIRLLEQHKTQFRLHHDAAMAFGQHFTHNKLSLDKQQLTALYKGQDLPASEQQACGDVLLCFDGFPVGLAKGLKGKLKNALPRELIRQRL